MNDEEAVAAVRQALAHVVSESEVSDLAPDEPFREVLNMDSLDFLSFVEQLSELTQVRIDEDSYARLTTVTSCAHFLQAARVG